MQLRSLYGLRGLLSGTLQDFREIFRKSAKLPTVPKRPGVRQSTTNCRRQHNAGSQGQPLPSRSARPDSSRSSPSDNTISLALPFTILTSSTARSE
jgi:hypothetical protein